MPYIPERDALSFNFLHPKSPVREITEGDLLTWQVQLKREGTLPPAVQLRLLEHLADRPVAV